MQQLDPEDYPLRVNFAQTMLEMMRRDHDFLDRVLWTDEATFTRAGSFNTHNLHYYSIENPHVVRPTRFQIQFKYNVWAGMIGDRLIGPVILPDIMDTAAYTLFIRHELPRLLQEAGLNHRNIWLQQDGAPPHWGLEARAAVQRLFQNRWIGRQGRGDVGVPWPPRSPDLAPCDFFLWGRVKELVYEVEIRDAQQLRRRIFQAFNRVRNEQETIINAVRSVRRRLQLCIQRDGGYIEQRIHNND